MILGAILIFGVLTLLYFSIIKWLEALGEDSQDH